MSLWSFTIDDTSPTLSYSPFRYVDSLTTGWKSWYSGSGYDISTNQGDSFHVTGMAEARMSLQFFGTAISLHGASNTTYEVTVDTVPFLALTPTGDKLFSIDNLFVGTHSVSIVNRGSTSESQLLSISHALVSTPLSSIGTSMQPVPYYADSTNFQMIGSWEVGASSTPDEPKYIETMADGATLALNFTGAGAISVRGHLGPKAGIYSVTLNRIPRTLNATSDRNTPDGLLYFQPGLDPQQQYQVVVSNPVGGRSLAVTSFTTFQEQAGNATTPPPPAGPPAPVGGGSTNLGVIIGPVAAIITVFLSLAFLLRWWTRRRSKQLYLKQHNHDSSAPPLGVPRSLGPTPVPYRMNTPNIPRSGINFSTDFVLLDKLNATSDQDILLKSKSSNTGIATFEIASFSSASSPNVSPATTPATAPTGILDPQPKITVSDLPSPIESPEISPQEIFSSPLANTAPTPTSPSEVREPPTPPSPVYKPGSSPPTVASPTTPKTFRKLPVPPLAQQHPDQMADLHSPRSAQTTSPLPTYRP